MRTRTDFSNNSYLHILLIITLGLVVYSNTFNAPFQWDDLPRISGNQIVKELPYFAEPWKAKGLEHYDAFKNRYVGYLTFALNYRFNGMDVRGYHIVNTGIHLVNAVLVYLLVVLTLKTPFLTETPSNKNSKPIALLAALLFVCHPVQTEAVTYIFQRLASLAALFYLASLALYAKWRLMSESGDENISRAKRALLYCASIVCAVLAMKTKEIAFTLPVIIALYEFLFFDGKPWRRLLHLTPLFLTMLIIPLGLIGTDRPMGEILAGFAQATEGYKGFARGEYLITELRVLTTYMRLIFLPVGQNIDYDYPLYRSFFQPQVLLSSILVTAMLLLALSLIIRSKSRPELRLAGFGILWFFITLSVESSIIPIPMLINEYRLYLPSAGAFTAMALAASLTYTGALSARLKAAYVIVLAVALLSLSAAAYARNSVWRSEISLWEDVTRKSPMKARGHAELGAYLVDKGFVEQGIAQYQTVLKLNPYYGRIYYNLGTACMSKGRFDMAVEYLQRELSYDYGFPDAHLNLGYSYMKLGDIEKARREFEITLSLDPRNHKARQHLGYINGRLLNR